MGKILWLGRREVFFLYMAPPFHSLVNLPKGVLQSDGGFNLNVCFCLPSFSLTSTFPVNYYCYKVV